MPFKPWQALLCLLLLACDGPPDPAPSRRPQPPEAVIRDWKLSSQGEWQMKAASAVRRQGRWQVSELQWTGSGIRILSPVARQTAAETFALEQVKVEGDGIQARAFKSELRLDQRQVKGGTIEMQGPGWSLSGKSFSAAFPLRRWQLRQVRARFQTGK